MKTTFSLPSMVLALVLTICPLHAGDNPGESSLATDVMKAAGIENWWTVSRLKFTFNKHVNGERKLSAVHDWNIAGGKDTVKWGEKTATADIWNPDNNQGDAAEAYKRWVNDSYWLLAPLKLGDRGITVKDGSTKVIGDESLPTLQLSFDNVGLTSNDRYVLYVDPETKLVKFWDYMPDEKTRKTATWEQYVQKGGLTLSTRHQMGDVLITFTDIEVTTD